VFYKIGYDSMESIIYDELDLEFIQRLSQNIGVLISNQLSHTGLTD
jgi:hypothetical protein